MDSNRIFEDALRDKVGSKQIKLPKWPGNRFETLDGNPKHVVLTLSSDAVIANLQTNPAAFESWLLALKIWGVIERATLRWDPPRQEGVSDSKWRLYWCHYQRFLYRVNFFNQIFGAGAWFVVEKENAIRIREHCDALNEKYRQNGSLILNIPDKDEHGTPGEGKLKHTWKLSL